MPCTARSAAVERQAALKRLEKQLKGKTARLIVKAGRISVEGWRGNRAGFCDECATAALRLSSDFQVRRLLQVLDQTYAQIQSGGRT